MYIKKFFLEKENKTMKVLNFKKADVTETRSELGYYKIHVINNLGWFVIQDEKETQTLLIDPENFNSEMSCSYENIRNLLIDSIRENFGEKRDVELCYGKDFLPAIKQIIKRNREHAFVV